MINKQAIETMTQMLTLINKYGADASPDAETVASSENRRRAFVITKMLSSFAQRVADSDMYYLRFDDTSATNAERSRCYQIAKQLDRGFMREVAEFQELAEKFQSSPACNNDRTENDIVLELECHLHAVKVLQEFDAKIAGVEGDKLTEREVKLQNEKRSVIAEKLVIAQQQLKATSELALSRGMVVSMNQRRTVIKRVAPNPAHSTKQAFAATKVKKAPGLKLVAKKTAPQSKTKASSAKKSS
jgi:hypothetical protein